ncbi:AbrB/MazE/SpoVT family DNA-binding domain-containing protein [Oscillibacter sp.]|uniref:AbrB/MazE/SpoVT family DNA-binding domain-containing protein n=1 Tax=Oscillibacter sp. TaxID=1945593 RepID=UPI001B429E6C|nr:AbrB/MazE/SpoVT family DNA-binding domain-containing protein [Oscillibacter sp.]MBP3510312.1 AbrB/MazE/SpoVT family DNA-binding domain-containing protein [Oscillibacter sp.]
MKKSEGKFAGTVRVGEKGQIVIPKGARDLLGIQPGDTMLVLADEKRGIAVTKDDVLLQQFEAILGTEKEK